MLVLTRKMQERIQIGENITITVVRIKGNTVRVGIEAPRDVRVARGEVFSREPSEEMAIQLTTDAGERPQDEPPSDSTGEETIDKPAAPWQAIQSGRRGPQCVSERGNDVVPTNAV